MAATRQNISEWFDRGIKHKATHMVIMCDDFDHQDYPVYCDCRGSAEHIVRDPGHMQRVMEVYNLSMDKEKQLNKPRCFQY